LKSFVSAIPKPTDDSNIPKDNYLWLEVTNGEKSLAWAREQNAITIRELESSPDFSPLRAMLLANANEMAKWNLVTTRQGDIIYNFIQSEAHPHGIWRRTTQDILRTDNPEWETVLDLDALAASEKENWVLRGNPIMNLGDNPTRALVLLSRGGVDAFVVREFDLKTKTFVSPDEGGFVLPEGINLVSWRDADTLFVAANFGRDSFNQNGFPRILKEWKRGTPLSDAKTIFKGLATAGCVYARQEDGHIFVINQLSDTSPAYTAFLFQDGKLTRLNVPAGSNFNGFKGQIIITLSGDWSAWSYKQQKLVTYSGDSIIAGNFDGFLEGKCEFTTLLPTQTNGAMFGTSHTQNYFIVSLLDNLQMCYRAFRFNQTDNTWESVAIDTPQSGTVNLFPMAPDTSDDIQVSTQDYLESLKVMCGTIGKSGYEIVRQYPDLFDATGMEKHRHEAISKDGTRIPYFVVTPKNFSADGSTPTILSGYGAYGIFNLPEYLPDLGKCWLERGGAYVYACIRGGGEFDPKWRRDGAGINRQNSFDDFHAVAQDLIRRKITSPEHLGIRGQSSGGLLMAVSFIQHPELFRAVVCEAPLLDMRRYTAMAGGASFMTEYGNPNHQVDWDVLGKFSPYQNVKPAAQVKYPRVLFTTATNDNRVSPAHARKMAARMEEMGHDVLFYERTDGGHQDKTDINQSTYYDALIYTFFSKELGLDSRN